MNVESIHAQSTLRSATVRSNHSATQTPIALRGYDRENLVYSDVRLDEISGSMYNAQLMLNGEIFGSTIITGFGTPWEIRCNGFVAGGTVEVVVNPQMHQGRMKVVVPRDDQSRTYEFDFWIY